MLIVKELLNGSLRPKAAVQVYSGNPTLSRLIPAWITLEPLNTTQARPNSSVSPRTLPACELLLASAGPFPWR